MESKSATEIEFAIRLRIGRTDCRINVGPDSTGWHATVAGWDPIEIFHVTTLVMNAEEELKRLYKLKAE
jgi:hypothetical protein